MKIIEFAFLALLSVSVIANESSDGVKEQKEKSENAEEPVIRLQSTFVGDKEQPAVSYFIPWQGTSTPDKLQWEIQQKHDATLQLIDRDVMVRSIDIYNGMNLESGDLDKQVNR